MSWLIILSQSNSFVFLILWSIFPILYPVFYMPLQSIGEWQILHFTLYKPSKDPFSFICNKDENLLDAADKRHVNHCIISLSMNISFLSKGNCYSLHLLLFGVTCFTSQIDTRRNLISEILLCLQVGIGYFLSIDSSSCGFLSNNPRRIGLISTKLCLNHP